MTRSRVFYPGNRMAIDRDGTSAIRVDREGGFDSLVLGETLLNEEGAASGTSYWPESGAGTGSIGDFVLLFPFIRNVRGWYIRVQNHTAIGPSATPVEYSLDTTDGMDGEWISASATWGDVGSANPSTSWRDEITSASPAFDCKAVRFRYSGGFDDLSLENVHLFGVKVDVATRLQINDILDQGQVSVSALDWGDVPFKSSRDIRFRVKNVSPSVIAEDVQVTLDGGSPLFVDRHLLSYDDGLTYGPSVVLGRIEPGDVSGPVTLRHVTPDGVESGPFALRIIAEALSWRNGVSVIDEDGIEYVLASDVGSDVPTPVMWWADPTRATAGASVTLYGYGFGDSQGSSSVTYTDSLGIEKNASPIFWEPVAPTDDALTPRRAHIFGPSYINTAYQRIGIIVPDDAQLPTTQIRVDTG